MSTQWSPNREAGSHQIPNLPSWTWTFQPPDWWGISISCLSQLSMIFCYDGSSKSRCISNSWFSGSIFCFHVPQAYILTLFIHISPLEIRKNNTSSVFPTAWGFNFFILPITRLHLCLWPLPVLIFILGSHRIPSLFPEQLFQKRPLVNFKTKNEEGKRKGTELITGDLLNQLSQAREVQFKRRDFAFRIWGFLQLTCQSLEPRKGNSVIIPRDEVFSPDVPIPKHSSLAPEVFKKKGLGWQS